MKRESTGFNDADGREVFTGDVLENGIGERFIVERREGGHVNGMSEWVDVHYQPTVMKDRFWSCTCNLGGLTGKRVVGNVFDNPDLMEVRLFWACREDKGSFYVKRKMRIH